jgi:flagellar P-ring protein FlgI
VAPDAAGINAVPMREPASVASDGGSKKDAVKLIKESVSVGELVQSLNQMGVSPKDLIVILQNIKASGALQGELEIL